MSIPEDGSVYLIRNVRTGTCIDLDGGNAADGTKVQGYEVLKNTCVFNQLWLVQSIGNDLYTLRNLRSGTYLDMDSHNTKNATRITGFRRASNPSSPQEWRFLAGGRAGAWMLQNNKNGLVADLGGGNSANGTVILGFTPDKDNDNQNWLIERQSRKPSEIQDLLKSSPYLHQDEFKSYIQDGSYVPLPQDVRDQIFADTGLRNTSWRKEIFDCDDFAFVAKAAVAKWGNQNLLADGFAIIFGVMFGRRSSGAGHAFNWYISSDKNSIKFFEPQSGKESDDPDGYNGYFGVF